MIHRITIHDLIKLPAPIPVLDVRTPAEFSQGHIPGAFNLPLFTNEERVRVGTTYKQIGREQAILLGFELTGPKWAGFIRQALDLVAAAAPDPQSASGKKVAVHCWRGGMRSGAMAWALDLYGFDVYLVEGGYKRYRRWVRAQFETPRLFRVIGGMTGSGKTRVLHQLRAMQEQVIDLEALARHQGSTYGTLNRLVQPTQEQFENDLADQLYRMDPARKIWIEDEAITIGRCTLPGPLWNRMQTAILFDLQVPVTQRVCDLVQEYGSLDKDFLVECTDRIRKRLGPEQTKYAIVAIREDRMDEFIRLVLVYYDKSYRKALNARDAGRVFPVPLEDADPARNARRILDVAQALPVLIENITF